MTTAAIEFARIRSIADLRGILAGDCGEADRTGRFHCAIHDDRDAALEYFADTNTFKCWSCGLSGDVFDWWANLRRMTVHEVAEAIDPLYRTSTSSSALKPRTRPGHSAGP